LTPAGRGRRGWTPGAAAGIVLTWAALGSAALAAPAAPPAHGRTQVAANDLPLMSWRDIPFRTVVRQQYDFSCGSAALATLLRFHYGRNVGEAEIFRAMFEHGDKAKIEKVGFSLLDMKTYVVSHGLSADGYRGDVHLLDELKSPAIAVITIGPYKHFVVVKGVIDGHVLVGDPALGLKVYTTPAFMKLWNGIVLIVRSDDGSKVIFNDPAEWRPWARAPVEQAARGRDLQFLSDFPPIFQVVQLRAN
jgi:hypothetical protein